MAMKGSGGGGYGSRPHVETPVKTGTGSKSARPAGVAQIGLAWGRHITRSGESNYSGEKLHNPERNFNPTKFGNESRPMLGVAVPVPVERCMVNPVRKAVMGNQRKARRRLQTPRANGPIKE
jgi:hypothetical protein